MRKSDAHLVVDNHYLGKPARAENKIVARRIRLLKQLPGFCDRNASLVDAGCGNGASLFALSDTMKKCTGLEIYEGHVAEFEKLKKEAGGKNCDIVLFDVEKDVTDKQFDRLISFELIEHLRDEKNVARLAGLVREGGLAAITVPNKWWLFETHGAKFPIIGTLPWYFTPFLSWLPKPIHERFALARIYTKKRVRKLLESAGFEVMDIQYVTAPLDVLPKGAMKSFFTKHVFKNDTTRIPFLATALFISAKKY